MSTSRSTFAKEKEKQRVPAGAAKMQASVLQVPLLRPTANSWRQSSMHLQPAGLGRHGHGHALAQGHSGVSLARSQFLHGKPAAAGHQKSRSRHTPEALAMEALAATTSSSAPLLAGALGLVGALMFVLNGGKKEENLPPGPLALEFLAKFVNLRRSVFYVRPLLTDLHERYGGIFSVRLFKTFVFVKDRALTHKMLVKGGATFADRPEPVYQPWPMFFDGGILIRPYGAYWRRLRRNLVEALHPARVARFKQARSRARGGLLARLVAAGAGGGEVVTPRETFRRTLFDLLAYMTLGPKLSTERLDEIFMVQKDAFAAVTGFSYFVAFVELTKRIFWKRWAALEDIGRRRDAILSPLIQARRASSSDGDMGTDMDTDEDPPCYADTLLAVRLPDEGERALTNDEIVALCSEFMVAGTDTTASLLEWLMAELVNRPDVQAKVYQEVSREEELKESDLAKMPYLKAVVLEGLRLHPGAHLIFPHRTMKDTEVGGYTLPKDTEVNFLVADYGLDPTVWTDPAEFRPERFLEGGEGHGVDITGNKEVKMIPFGAGRRMCPGYGIATLHLQSLVASLIREFEWLPAVQGQKINMAEDLDGVIVLKDPLRVRLNPRRSSELVSTLSGLK